jgi:crotonobetainyl-CoA:carnitine CoA-transferase CaiB-like acyl-CoA transferase
MSGALDGLRIVDFGQYIAGPLVAQMLGDHGAEVVRIDPPGGPRWKHPANAVLQRGKFSLVLDLTQPHERAVAQQLVSRADVLIENFRPGVMQRLQLGANEMTGANPGLIYCSIPGFASDDSRSKLYAREGVVGAAAGLYGSRDGDPREPPIYNTLPLASCFGALIAANSIVAALIARERTGLGQAIEVSMFEASFELTRYYGDRTPGAPHPRIRLGATTTMALTQHYQCKDGRFVHLSWLEGRQLDAFARLVGLHEEWSSAGLLDHARVRSDRAYSAQLRAALAGVFKTRTAAEWMALANPDADLAECLTSEEWLISDPQARATGAVITLDDPELGLTHQAGYPISMSLTPPRARGPRHVLGADHQDAPRRWTTPPSFSNRQVPADGSLRHPLEGIRALDLTQILAGPTACRILAEYGADVVQIVNPHARAGRDFHFSVNNGKRSMLLDLKQPGAMEVFWRLIERADVVSTNFSSEVGARLGVDEASVRRHRPEVIYSRISAYGLEGPLREFRGHDQVGQAVTGMEIRWAGEHATPLMQPHPLNDFGTGQLAAFSIMLALLHRMRTGQGQLVGASLAQTATFLQAPYMLAYPGKKWSDEPGGQQCLGVGVLEQLHRAEDRWLFVAARSLDELKRVPDLADLADAEQLGERIRRLPAAVWVGRFAAAGIGAHVLNTPDQAMLDDWACTHNVSRQVVFPEAGAGAIVGPSPRLSRTPMRAPVPTPPPGWHARELLEELGFSEQVTELEETGAVVFTQRSERLMDPAGSGQRPRSG